MCFVAILNRVVEDAPVIVAANREEAYARGGTPPQVAPDGVRFVAGLDPVAGGTWLGLNQHGLLVAVTNRRGSAAPGPPAARSRGLLACDLLQCRTASAAALQAARDVGTKRYAACNLLLADAESVQVLHAGDWLRLHPLPPGFHVLTTSDINNAADPRVAYALAWLARRRHASSGDWLSALQMLCSKTGGGPGEPPICFHGDERGTVSSSLIVVRQPISQSSYWHCQGPPDRNPYQDFSHLVKALR